jgi:hypothetical protein
MLKRPVKWTSSFTLSEYSLEDPKQKKEITFQRDQAECSVEIGKQRQKQRDYGKNSGESQQWFEQGAANGGDESMQILICL